MKDKKTVKEPKGPKIKKTRSKKEIAFQIINSVLVVAVLGFYTYRLFYYKSEFDKKRQSVNTVFFSDTLINSIDLMSESGLHENTDGSYTVTGMATTNYVSYSGMTYRVVGINTNGNVILVSENPLTVLSSDATSSFESSSLYRWLNSIENDPYSGIFYNSLNMPFGTLATGSRCLDIIDDVSTIGCTQTNDSIEVSLLTLNDYKNAGAKDSYLNNQQSFWLSSQNSTGQYWYVTADGTLSLASEVSQMFGVRPVITLSYEVIASAGKGTAANPYVISTSAVPATAGDCQPGDYVSYGGQLWRIEQTGDSGTVAIMDGVIKNADGTDYLTSYGKTNLFTTASGLGKYLNSTFIKTLPDYKNVLVEYSWSYGGYPTSGPFDYTRNYEASYKSYVGIPNASFMFLNEYGNIFLSTYNSDTDKLIYTISEDFNLYATLLADTARCRPVICFNAAVAVSSGSGSQADPYLIGGGV